MSKNYYLCGYYGMENSGDDALLLSTMLGASRFLKVDTFSVNSPTQLQVPKRGVYQAKLVKTQRFRGENRLRQCFSASQSDGVIFGGGSVLHCDRDIQTKRLMMKLAGKGPHLALGVGIGPFANSRAEKACAKFLNECTYTGVRDSNSFAIAKSISPKANIEQTFDLAPALTAELDKHFFNNQYEDQFRRGIGVALCPRESLAQNQLTNEEVIKDKQGGMLAEQRRIRAISEGLAQVHRATGEPIFLIDFNGHSTLGDAAVHDEIQKYLPVNIPVFRVPYDANPIRVMARLAKLKAVVSMRLHGSILSYMTDTPVISINYHSKCEGWCDQVGMPNEYRFNADLIDSNQLAKVVIDGVEGRFSSCKLSKQEAYARSIRNFTSPLITSLG